MPENYKVSVKRSLVFRRLLKQSWQPPNCVEPPNCVDCKILLQKSINLSYLER